MKLHADGWAVISQKHDKISNSYSWYQITKEGWLTQFSSTFTTTPEPLISKCVGPATGIAMMSRRVDVPERCSRPYETIFRQIGSRFCVYKPRRQSVSSRFGLDGEQD